MLTIDNVSFYALLDLLFWSSFLRSCHKLNVVYKKSLNVVIAYVEPKTKHVPPTPTANHNGAVRPRKSAINVLSENAIVPSKTILIRRPVSEKIAVDELITSSGDAARLLESLKLESVVDIVSNSASSEWKFKRALSISSFGFEMRHGVDFGVYTFKAALIDKYCFPI